MRSKSTFLVAAIAAAFVASAVHPANAQVTQGGMNSGMMQNGRDHGMMSHGMMQNSSDQNTMGHGMMQCMKDEKGAGMMDHHGGGMMMGMMGSGMMQGGTGPGMATLFGSRVTPVMNLSEGDVRSYLASQIERLNNKRIKVGDIKSDDGTVTADIVTVDNSLVQRLKVNRHTGAIDYEN